MNYSPLSSTSCSFPPLREICSLDPRSWTDNWVWAELDQASSCTFPGLLVESLEFLPTNQNKRTNLLKKLLILLKWMKHKARAYVVEPESSLSLNFKCHVREKKNIQQPGEQLFDPWKGSVLCWIFYKSLQLWILSTQLDQSSPNPMIVIQWLV